MNFVRLEVLVEHFEEIGDYEIAESMLRQLITLKERDCGVLAAELIPYLYNLALLQEAQNQRAESLRNAKRAYSIAKNHRTSCDVDIHDIRETILRLTNNRAA